MDIRGFFGGAAKAAPKSAPKAAPAPQIPVDTLDLVDSEEDVEKASPKKCVQL